MFFISWSGVGLLVPAIAFLTTVVTMGLLGHSVPTNVINFISALITAIALAAAGIQFRKHNVRRNLYFIPMEYWSIAAGLMALSCIPGMFHA